MKIINGFITAADSLEVTFQPGDSMADFINPGSWETKAIAAGGRGIVWTSPNGKLETPEQYVGAVCKVTPMKRPSVVFVKVETDVSTDKGKTFRPCTGEMEVQFVESGMFTQLAIVSNDPAALTYKKIA